MKIIIAKSDTTAGERFYAYRSGVLSFFGIYIFHNRMILTGANSKQECLKYAKEALVPTPKPNTRVVGRYEI